MYICNIIIYRFRLTDFAETIDASEKYKNRSPHNKHRIHEKSHQDTYPMRCCMFNG